MDRKPTNPATSPGKPSASSNDRIASLFRSFHLSYGNLWEDRWGGQRLSDVAAYWSAELERFDDPTVRAAREAWKDKASSFPPTCDEFVALCKEMRPRLSTATTLRLSDKRPPKKADLEQLGKIIGRAFKVAKP